MALAVGDVLTFTRKHDGGGKRMRPSNYTRKLGWAMPRYEACDNSNNGQRWMVRWGHL